METNERTDCQLHQPKQINLNETALPIQLENIEIIQPPTKECRICLSSTSTNNNPFISPCECLGSLKFIHRLCLQQWMEIKFTQNLDDQSRSKNLIDCQLCKAGIKVQLKYKRECRNRSKIFKKIKRNPVVFLICLIGLVISLGALFYSINSLVNQIQYGYSDIELISKAVILVSIAAQIPLFLYFLVQILNFCTIRRAKLQVG